MEVGGEGTTAAATRYAACLLCRGCTHAYIEARATEQSQVECILLWVGSERGDVLGMAEDNHAFALRHHELRLARLRRDSEMQTRAQREKEERELTFHPETHKNFHFKADPTKNTDNFMERVSKYEELRQLRLAQLHRKAWM